MRKLQYLIVLFMILVMAGCSISESAETPHAPDERAEEENLASVTLMLDWVPNTNHTGFFVAQHEGYFQEAGLDVEIVQPGEVFAEQAVAGGRADFGVSFQEQVTLARASNETPLVSIAAIIQHNTSGFASLASKGADSPADWAGMTYGAFGSPFEDPTLEALMICDGGDFSELEIVDTGFADPLALLQEEQVDLAWIFKGWQGFQAEQQGIDLNIVMMNEYFDCIPDYYTPLIITSEEMIAQQPEIVRSFTEAVSRGYTFVIENPQQGATVLLEEVPELDEELVRDSQDWVSGQYAADAPQWGYQTLSRWQEYGDWMVEQGIIEGPFDAEAAFTTEYLP